MDAIHPIPAQQFFIVNFAPMPVEPMPAGALPDDFRLVVLIYEAPDPGMPIDDVTLPDVLIDCRAPLTPKDSPTLFLLTLTLKPGAIFFDLRNLNGICRL